MGIFLFVEKIIKSSYINAIKKTDGIKLIGPKGLKLYNLLLFSLTPITPTTYLQGQGKSY